LRCKIVNLIGLVFLHKADEIGRVGEIAVVHEKARLVLMRVKIETVDARRVERGRPSLNAVDDIAPFEKETREIGSILSGNSRNESDASCHSLAP
jgi:hypothetical protein